MTFETGDFLIFQIESGYGLLRILDVQVDSNNELIWHISAYGDFFQEVEMAELALENNSQLMISLPHAALTNRAFLSTQVSRLGDKPLTENDLVEYRVWQQNPNRKISDRSIRLMLGLR